MFAAVLLAPQAVDARTSRPIARVAVTVRDDVTPGFVDVEAAGAVVGYADFHGRFPCAKTPRSIRLTAITPDESHALDQLNRFRAHFELPALSIDENLTETAEYWAGEERRSGRIGHTCAALDDPAGCVEFNDFFHRLPGAPQDWDSGQNAAFDPIPSWSDPDSGFEDEQFKTSGERGHFLNLVEAKHWIGFGEVQVPGSGSYFAMNVL